MALRLASDGGVRPRSIFEIAPGERSLCRPSSATVMPSAVRNSRIWRPMASCSAPSPGGRASLSAVIHRSSLAATVAAREAPRVFSGAGAAARTSEIEPPDGSTTSVKSSLEIAQEAELRPIQEIAAAAGLEDNEVEPYGRYKAKVSLSVLERLKDKPDGKIICVTAITPTKAGEGKTTTSVSLTQGMGAIGEQALLCLREASLGPVFGIKGGAAGAGYAQVVPMEDLNLHFTGDMHAISAANNLLAAFLDAHVMHGNELDIDPHSISWRRCVDMNDRGLRQIITGLGGATNGSPRETGFDITAASEVMAILALARDLTDLRQRLGSITVAYSHAGDPVTAEDIGCAGSMTVLLKDAIMPNLVQTLEGQPAFVHCGPFANIAHGNSSLIADRIALKMADYVITESGFGADMGMQKFMDIVCRQGGIRPAAVVVVATVKALRVHGGSPDGTATSPEESMTPAARRHRQPGRAHPHRAGLRRAVRRGGQPLPDRHRRGVRARAHAGARGRRASMRSTTPPSPTAARARPTWRARSSRRPTRPATSSSRTRTRPRSRTRSPPSRPRSTAPTASSSCPRRAPSSSASRSSATAACRSAWPRRISRSRTTRPSRALRPASRCRSATCASTPARAS